MPNDAAPLYVGRLSGDAVGLQGTLDEFRLYKTALSQDSIRGLMWFLKGANNVLVPRGLFFSSKLFAALNGSYDTGSPLNGATIHGNDDNLSSNLNSRVIQMVIDKNLTLADAWRILDLARTNTTGNVTAFPLFVANEFYTLGVAKEVRDLAANAVVENSGNYSAPPPNPTLWELFWNAVAGWANAVWNAVVAVAQFFVNVVKWLVDAAIGIAIGLTTGDWTYFQRNVLDPLARALEALVSWLLDLLRMVVSVLFSPITNAIRDAMISFARTVASGLDIARRDWLATGSFGSTGPGIVASTLFGPYYQILLVVAIVIVVVLTIATPFLVIAGFIVGFIISLVLDFVLSGAFAGRPDAPGVSGPAGLLGLSNVLASIVGFMQSFVRDNLNSPSDTQSAPLGVRGGLQVHPMQTSPAQAFWWALGSAVLSEGSLFASAFSFALAEPTGKASSALSLAGSLLSLTMSIAFTLVTAFSQDQYGLGVISTIFSGVSLFTSAYSLYKSKYSGIDVKILSAVSTVLSLGSLAISLYTLF